MFPIGSDLTKRIIFIRDPLLSRVRVLTRFCSEMKEATCATEPKKTKRKNDEIILLPFLLLWLDVRWQKNLVT